MDNQDHLQKWKRDEVERFLRERAKKAHPVSIPEKIKFIEGILKEIQEDPQLKIDVPETLFSGEEYEKKRQIENPKFQFRPAAILLCTSNQHVQLGILLADVLNLEIRVRSGGHDHEGECSGTDALVIDFRNLNHIEYYKEGYKEAQDVVHIGPGAVFDKIVAFLNDTGIGIPHGTCGTVGIAGFTFGGGWGPWTRKEACAVKVLSGLPWCGLTVAFSNSRRMEPRNRENCSGRSEAGAE